MKTSKTLREAPRPAWARNGIGLAARVLLAGALPIQAASIIWTTSVVSDPSDISTSGTPVGALNVGANMSRTINGLTFAADPGGPGAIGLGSATVAFSFDDSFDNGMWAGASPGGSTDYNRALDTSRQTDVTTSGTVTLGSLVIGQNYEVQLWIVDTRPCCNNRARTVDGVPTHGANLNIARGTFTADATTQVITIEGVPGSHGPQVNLLQLRNTSPFEGPAYALEWTTLDGGGGTSSGGLYDLSSTIGQPDAGGPMTGGNYALTGGFWSIVAALQTPEAPLLTVETLPGGAVRVFWPRPATDFVLDESTALAASPEATAWMPVSVAAYATNATEISITIPAPAGNKFYRLRKP